MTSHFRIVVSLLLMISVSFVLFVFTAKLENVNNLVLKDKNLAIEYEYARFRSADETKAVHALDHLRAIPRNQKPEALHFGDNTYWHLLTLRNLRQAPSTYTYLFDNPMLDKIDIYRVNGQSLTLLKRLGDTRLDNAKGEIALPTITLLLEGQATEELLVRTWTTGVPKFPVALFEESGFQRYKNTVYLLWGALIGIVLVMTAYNLILYLGVQDKLYILYVGYILSFLVVLSFVHGFAIYLLPKAVYTILAGNLVPLYYLLGIFLLLFSFYFLKFNDESRSKISKAVKFFSTIMLVFGLYGLSQQEHEAAKLFAPMQAIMYGLCLLMLVKRMKQSNSWATLYIISWLPLLFGSAVGTMMLQGDLEYSFWTRHAAFFGVALEMALISMALAERLRVNKAQILFQATHDRLHNIANITKLKSVINKTPRLSDSKYTIVLIELEETAALVSSRESQQIKAGVEELIGEIQRFFMSYLHILTVDNDATFNKVCLVREGVFAMAVTSSDEALLKTTIDEFCRLYALNADPSMDFNQRLNFVIGAATRESAPSSVNHILSYAQQAINIAKAKQMKYWIFSELDRLKQQRRINLAIALQKAIDNESLSVFHQPKLAANDGKVIGSEILVRWEDQDYGEISPAEFIPIAKDTGLITELTKWVIEMSCRHLAQINAKIGRKYNVAINISIFDLQLPGFLNMIKNSVSKHHIAPSAVIFELTDIRREHIDENTLQVITRLKHEGYGISVDGLLVPLANIGHVLRGLVSEIKIDYQSVRNIQSITHNDEMLSTIAKMSKLAEVNIVGIGIESEQSEAEMIMLPCDILQGFNYCEPLPFEVYLNWLKTNY